jgi:hypothetical protein
MVSSAVADLSALAAVVTSRALSLLSVAASRLDSRHGTF